MLAKLFADGFVKATVAVIVILFATTSYLCVQNKAKQATIAIVENQLAQQQLANQQLHHQLANANKQIFDYLKQTKALQQKVVAQLQDKREKTDEILQILEKHADWSRQPVPDDVSRLLKPREYHRGKVDPVTLPHGNAVPNAANQH